MARLEDDEPLTPLQFLINSGKLLFAISPLLALGYVLMTGFEDESQEKAKRNKKSDFTMAGHDE